MSIARDIIVGRALAAARGERSAGNAVNEIRRARSGAVAVVKRGGGLPPTSSDGYDVVPSDDLGSTVTASPLTPILPPAVTPFTPPVPIMPVNRLSPGFSPTGTAPGTPGGGGISLGGVLQDLARRGVDALGRRIENQLAGPTSSPSSNCGTGMIRVGDTCVSLGDAFPGGDPFTMQAGGVPAVGAFGLPAFSPVVVGSVNGNPIRRCPARTVLGLDNLCYPKGTIGRNYRKHPPRPKPPVSAFDARMMRKYGKGGSKAAAAKKLAQEAGFTCKAK